MYFFIDRASTLSKRWYEHCSLDGKARNEICYIWYTWKSLTGVAVWVLASLSAAMRRGRLSRYCYRKVREIKKLQVLKTCLINWNLIATQAK